MDSFQSSDVWLGRLIGERQRYRLDRRLGSGGTAQVFLAMDTLLGQPVALKLLHEKLVAGEMRRRFEQEATLCAALRSDHIVRVSDYGVTPEGYPFFVMEYLSGQTLRQLLEQEKRLSVERTVHIIAQVCQGLHLAHRGVAMWDAGSNSSRYVKVVHRDLKPDNIFLLPMMLGEMVKILDFGIAKIRSGRAEVSNATTDFIGTYRYAAPEQFEVGQNLDERADIYGLGVILYEMLSGTDPFGFGTSVRQVSGGTWAVAHLSKPVLPLQEQPECEHIPSELAAAVMRCLEKAPDCRFASVSELNTVLHAAIHKEAPPLTQPSEREGVDSLDDSTPVDFVRWSAQALSPPLQESKPSNTPFSAAHSTRYLKTEQHQITPTANSLQPYRLVLLQTVAMIAAGLGFYYILHPLILPGLLSSRSQPEKTVAPAQAAPVDQPTVQAADATSKLLAGHLDTVWAVSVIPDGQGLVSGSFDKTLKLWSLKGESQKVFLGHTDAVRSVATSADGRTMVSGSSDKTIKVWDMQAGNLLQTLVGHSGPVWSVAISPDGQTLASGSYDGTIKIWNLQTGQLLRTLPEHYDSVWSVTISPDGQTLASGSYDGRIKIWNLQTGALLRSLTGHTEAVRSVAISQDRKTLASASWDKTVKIWDLQTGALLQTLSGHSDRVVSVAFDPTGQTVASGSLDHTIKIWSLKSGQSLRTLTGHSDWVISVAFTPDGKALVSGSKDKTVRIWQPF
jgi:WD40 repeat protein/serine/threonine protein kinase